MEEQSELTNIIVQFVSMLLSCGDMDQRRSLAKMMHSFQIVGLRTQKNPSNLREIEYVMDTIEDCSKYRATKNLRILRDLFSSNPKQREVATHMLKKNWDRPEVEDVLRETLDLKS